MSEFVTASDGVKLAVEVHGEGPPILFSCGYCTTRENWRAHIPALNAAGMKVVLWDYRGHGRSDVPEDLAAYTLDQVLDDMGRVLDHAAAAAAAKDEPDEPAVLAGHSFGGMASLHFAANHPERVRALVVMGSGPGFKNLEAGARWAAQVEKTASVMRAKGLEAFLAGRAGATCIGRMPELPSAQAAARAICEQSIEGLALFGKGVAGPAASVIDALPGIKQPTLILVGEEDDAYLRAAEVMKAKLPNAERVLLAGAGHVANIEAPEAFEQSLIEFLGRLSASK